MSLEKTFRQTKTYYISHLYCVAQPSPECQMVLATIWGGGDRLSHCQQMFKVPSSPMTNTLHVDRQLVYRAQANKHSLFRCKQTLYTVADHMITEAWPIFVCGTSYLFSYVYIVLYYINTMPIFII